MTNGKLLFYTHGLVGGGAERVWALMAKGLHERGWEVTFGVDFEAPENEGLLPPDMKRVVFGQGHWKATRNIAHFLSREQPKVAFAAVGASNLKLLAGRMMSSWRGPAVLSAHGRMDAEQRFLGRLTYALTPLTSRMSARTIAVSTDLRDYLRHRFWAHPSRTVTIPNGIHLPAIMAVPTREVLHARENRILAVGRLVPEKDYPTLLRAVAACRVPASLDILGDGPERSALTALASSLGLSNRVRFLGYVNEPWHHYANAKMLALTSKTEAFGNVLVEAMGYGLPVVATRCGGPDEILEGGRFGRLVPIADHEAVASALETVLTDPGDPAKHRARADVFSVDNALDRYEALIREVAPA